MEKGINGSVEMSKVSGRMLSEETVRETGKETVQEKFPVRSVVSMGMFVAILGISAYISVPLPLPGAPHITLQNFCVILIALLFPAAQAFMIIFAWMLLGVVGVPVFIGAKAGPAYLVANPWAGYTLAFLLVALLIPLICGKNCKRLRYTIAAIAGVLIIDIFGMFFLRVYPQSGYNWPMAVGAGFFAFLPLDLIKAVVAAQIVPAFKKVIDPVLT